MTTRALCNQALAELAAPEIASFDEGSVESVEVERVRQSVMDELLDWTEWHWTEARVVLAAVPNDRPAEWTYAYARPADCAVPIAVRRVEAAALHLPLAGPDSFPRQDAMPLRFLVAGNVIYTNVEAATLVYHRSGEFTLPPLVARAYVLTLATRICYPIKKDSKLRAGLAREAAIAQAIAVADERNKSPAMQPRYVSEVEYARAGVIDW